MIRRAAGVPIELIKNANPAFVRRDMGDIQALARDIDQYALRHPLVLAGDYQMIDGARRLLALELLGWREIPALSTDDWATIRDRLIKNHADDVANELADPLLKPMDWRELRSLRSVLKPIYDRAWRQGPKNPRGAGRKIKDSQGRLVRDMVEITGVSFQQLVALAQLWSQLTLLEKSYPEQLVRATKITDAIQGLGEHQTHAAIRELRSLRYDESKDVEPSLKKATKQFDVMTAGLRMAHTVASELRDLGELNPAISDDQIKELWKHYLRTMRVMARTRQRLFGRYNAIKLHEKEEAQS